jgi:FkbM family methyltransferase
MIWMIRLALALYAAAARLRLTETRWGRAAFLWVYTLYKTRVEARDAPRLLAYIPQGTIVIDVGANVGFFTRLFAHHLHTGQVIAIEPEACNVADLRAMLQRERLTERVRVVQALAADQTGERHLMIDPLHPANHQMGTEGILTPAVTLDDLVGETASRVSLIKIDVQGAERLVLEGAAHIVARDRPTLYVEVGGAEDDETKAVLEWLSQHGYHFYQLADDTMRPLTQAQVLATIGQRGYGDILCLPA